MPNDPSISSIQKVPSAALLSQFAAQPLNRPFNRPGLRSTAEPTGNRRLDWEAENAKDAGRNSVDQALSHGLIA